MSRTLLRLLLLMLIFSSTGLAQQTPAWEIFGGYSFERTDVREYYKSSPTLYTFRDRYINLNGWEAAVTENVNRWFGGTFQASGHYKSVAVLGTTNKEQNISAMYGPRIAQHMSWGTPYAHVLLGIGRSTVRVSPGPHAEENKFAVAVGAGLDIKLGNKFAVRALQLQYSPTNQVGTKNHKADASTGVVFYFGMISK